MLAAQSCSVVWQSARSSIDVFTPGPRYAYEVPVACSLSSVDPRTPMSRPMLIWCLEMLPEQRSRKFDESNAADERALVGINPKSASVKDGNCFEPQDSHSEQCTKPCSALHGRFSSTSEGSFIWTLMFVWQKVGRIMSVNVSTRQRA